VSPAGVVLVILVELAPDLDRVPATDHRENVANVVNTLAQCGVYISVSAGPRKAAIKFARAKTHCPGSISGPDRHVREHVGGSIGAIGWLQTQSSGVILA